MKPENSITRRRAEIGEAYSRIMAGEPHVRCTFDFDALLDAVAERIAAKIRLNDLGAGEHGQIKPRLLTVEDAGAYLSRSQSSVRHLISEGKLPTVKLDSRIYLDIRDLDRVIEEMKDTAR
jgi:hypothetical protein